MKLNIIFQNAWIKKLINFSTYGFGSCIILSLLIFPCLLINIDKYKAVLISTEAPRENITIYYEDLDNDGNSEMIEYVLGYNDRLVLMISSEGVLIGDIDLSGDCANTISPFIVDYDRDGNKEIFAFTIHNDTILMHCVDAINGKIEIENKMVCKAYKDRGVYDLTIYPCTAVDINKDGYKEIFFSIVSGYSTRPRNMFAYYPKNDSIMMSPESCSLIFSPIMFDFDTDNKPEFLGSTLATGNCGPDKKYSDQYSWLMVFTTEMKFKFPPVPIEAYPSISKFFPFSYGDKNYILVFHYYEGAENYPNFIALYDINGKLIRKKKFDKDIKLYYSCFFSTDKEYKDVRLLQKEGRIMQIDTMLDMKCIDKLENISFTNIVNEMDIDLDGEKEFIILGNEKGNLIIYRNDFSNQVALKLNENVSIYHMSIVNKKGALPKIFIETTENLYTFSYKPAILYKYRYLLIIPILLNFMAIRYIILKIREFRKLKVEKIQNQISELQIKSIQNQLDPHFTFNVFNSFANLINEKDTERANYIFHKYAGLLKAYVLNSDNITISLQEELNFVESYLELEKFRYANKFSFHIKMQENMNKQLIVPKMILHIFIENAIKHGLKHLDSGGHLLIEGKEDNRIIHISIRDNGIGRVKAKELGYFSTGKGIIILNKITEYYNKLYKHKITYTITDLYQNKKASGTEVNIQIPLCH
jgi:hypothetical protein